MKALFAVLVLYLFLSSGANATDDFLSKEIVVYKNPECSCCNKWINYLKDHGYIVTSIDTRNVYAEKERLGVPEKLAACHSAILFP
jgi:hypothetical protein